MTMTAETLADARGRLRILEKSKFEASEAMVVIVTEEVIELLDQLSVLPHSDREGFGNRLSRFLAEEFEV